MSPWSSGQDVALSRLNQGFDSPRRYQLYEALRIAKCFFRGAAARPWLAAVRGWLLSAVRGILYIDDSRQGCTLSSKICMACQIWHVLYTLRV